MMLDADTLKTLIGAFVALAGLQAWLTYALVHLYVTGRGVFQRKDDEEPARIHQIRER